MKPNPRALAALITTLALLLLTGCVALDIRQADQALIDNYSAKQTALSTGDGPLLMSTMSALDRLAKDSAAEGARTTNGALNRISFYRIATTAAWQAGSDDVLVYAKDGTALCNSPSIGTAPPRDCGMLLVFPYLASADKLTADFKALDRRLNSGPGDLDADRAEAERIYTGYEDAFDGVLDARRSIKGTDAPPAFYTALDSNLGALLCDNLEGMRGALVLTRSPRVREMQVDLSSRACQLSAAGAVPGSRAQGQCLTRLRAGGCP